MNAQIDLFALMAEPLDLTPIADTWDRDTREGWDAFRAHWEASEATDKFETLLWGKDRRETPHFELRLWCDNGGWRFATDYAFQLSGGGGPPTRERYASREAAILTAFRAKLTNLARNLSGCYNDSEGVLAQYRTLANWMIAQCPADRFGGIELAHEFDAMVELAAAREKDRCAALWAEHERKQNATSDQ